MKNREANSARPKARAIRKPMAKHRPLDQIAWDPATEEWLVRTEIRCIDKEALEEHKRVTVEQLNILKAKITKGDKVALRKLYESAYLAVVALEEVRTAHPQIVKELAAEKLVWPGGLSAYPTNIKLKDAYKEIVSNLTLATKIDSVFDTAKLFKKFSDHTIIHTFVIETLKHIQSIRRLYREATRLGWYDALKKGQDDFELQLATTGDAIAQRRIELAVQLPPFQSAEEACVPWIKAVQELLDAECDGTPERDPRFHRLGKSSALSKATSYKNRRKDLGLNDASFHANVRHAINKKVEAIVRYLAPAIPTEKIDDYIPPKKFRK